VVVFDYISHIIIGCLVGFGLDYFLLRFTLLEIIFYYGFIIIGSVLPDIDTPKSYLGHKFKLLSNFIFEVFGHRTLTHSILLMTILFFISVMFWGINTIIAGLTIGSVMHVLGDMLTGKVACLYPFNKNKIGFIK
jgi:inner membrane protein